GGEACPRLSGSLRCRFAGRLQPGACAPLPLAPRHHLSYAVGNLPRPAPASAGYRAPTERRRRGRAAGPPPSPPRTMPKRTDIRTILILGSGPIVIGQGCEFDYSGTQACKALRAEGFRVVLVNSNPATIMTDPEFSDRTYIEPITPAAVRKVIELQKQIGDPIDAILPTLGGQTALNCACALFDDGTLDEFGIEMIGANRHVIHRAEDRKAFNEVCARVNLRI